MCFPQVAHSLPEKDWRQLNSISVSQNVVPGPKCRSQGLIPTLLNQNVLWWNLPWIASTAPERVRTSAGGHGGGQRRGWQSLPGQSGSMTWRGLIRSHFGHFSLHGFPRIITSWQCKTFQETESFKNVSRLQVPLFPGVNQTRTTRDIESPSSVPASNASSVT